MLRKIREELPYTACGGRKFYRGKMDLESRICNRSKLEFGSSWIFDDLFSSRKYLAWIF